MSWERIMRLFRTLEQPHIRKGVDHVIQNRPAHRYSWNHWANYQSEIAELMDRGYEIQSYVNFFHSHHAAGGWDTSGFPGFIYDFAERHNLWLHMKNGEKARMWAYDGAPIVKIDAMSPMQIAEMGQFIVANAPTKILWTDQIWYQYFDWMFTNGDTADLADYDPVAFEMNVYKILDALENAGFTLLTNGADDRFEDKQLMWENADWQRYNEDWHDILSAWIAHPGDVLALVGDQRSSKVRLSTWIARRSGGTLWLKNDEAANWAWHNR